MRNGNCDEAGATFYRSGRSQNKKVIGGLEGEEDDFRNDNGLNVSFGDIDSLANLRYCSTHQISIKHLDSK